MGEKKNNNTLLAQQLSYVPNNSDGFATAIIRIGFLYPFPNAYNNIKDQHARVWANLYTPKETALLLLHVKNTSFLWRQKYIALILQNRSLIQTIIYEYRHLCIIKCLFLFTSFSRMKAKQQAIKQHITPKRWRLSNGNELITCLVTLSCNSVKD